MEDEGHLSIKRDSKAFYVNRISDFLDQVLAFLEFLLNPVIKRLQKTTAGHKTNDINHMQWNRDGPLKEIFDLNYLFSFKFFESQSSINFVKFPR